MIARFERSVWVLIVMTILLAVTAVVFPGTADAQDSAAAPFEAVADPDEVGEAVPLPSTMAKPSTIGNDKSQLPGLVIAALVFGIAIFSAWKLPMSHEAGGYTTQTEGAREWENSTEPSHGDPDNLGAAPGPSGAAQVSIGSRGADSRGADPPSRGDYVPGRTTDTGSILSASKEVELETLAEEIEVLRQVVEEQNRRLASAEEENSRLRQVLGSSSLVAGSHGPPRRAGSR